MDAATTTSLGHTLFGLATLVTLLSALDAFLNAKTRWRQLRSSSGALEAVLWLYRARVGRFQQSISETARPETELCEAINMWRDELVSAADLQTTDLERLRPPKVYLHHQNAPADHRPRAAAASQGLPASPKRAAGAVMEPGSDDHHSPIKPDQYIALRLDKMMRFYQRRLPIYTRLRFVLRTTVLLCTASSAVLSYLDLASWVIGVTSLAGAVVSWSEFSETERKIERYTRAVRSVKKVLSWWDVLTDVEKAGADNIATLIETGESIIADERQAWQSTANRLAAAQRGPEVAAGAQPPSTSASGEPERRAAPSSSLSA